MSKAQQAMNLLNEAFALMIEVCQETETTQEYGLLVDDLGNLAHELEVETNRD